MNILFNTFAVGLACCLVVLPICADSKNCKGKCGRAANDEHIGTTSLAFRSGLSINKAKETNLIRYEGIINTNLPTPSMKTTAEKSMPFLLDITYQPSSLKHISWTLSGLFMPTARIKTIASKSIPGETFLRYINAGVSSYGMLARINLYKTFGHITPYVTGGIGPLVNRIETSTFVAPFVTRSDVDRKAIHFNKSKLNLAWQLGGGMKYSFKQISLDLGYIYLDRGKVETQDFLDQTDYLWENKLHFSKGAAFRLTSHQLLAGLEIKL